MLFPFVPFIFEVGLIVYWVAVTAVLYSAGEATPHWRTSSNSSQPLGFQQLMFGSNATAPGPPPSVNITGMSREVRPDSTALGLVAYTADDLCCTPVTLYMIILDSIYSAAYAGCSGCLQQLSRLLHQL